MQRDVRESLQRETGVDVILMLAKDLQAFLVEGDCLRVVVQEVDYMCGGELRAATEQRMLGSIHLGQHAVQPRASLAPIAVDIPEPFHGGRQSQGLLAMM